MVEWSLLAFLPTKTVVQGIKTSSYPGKYAKIIAQSLPISKNLYKKKAKAAFTFTL